MKFTYGATHLPQTPPIAAPVAVMGILHGTSEIGLEHK